MELSNLKKVYEKPEIEVTEFEIEDITCSSITHGADWLDVI
jgi:hypothetical protein